MSTELTDEVLRLIAAGEGRTLEYKSSLRWDYKDLHVNKELTKVVVRTIAAFLNSQGGTLLIGVRDDGTVLGLESDFATLGKKTADGFELNLRSAIANHLGDEVDPLIQVTFVAMEAKDVAVVSCAGHSAPVYFRDGNKRELCVRAGNLTRSLDPAAAIAYADSHWKASSGLSEERLRELIVEALDRRGSGAAASVERPEQVPIWMNVATHRVLDLFLSRLSQSHGWKRLYIVSPWISEVAGPSVTLNFDQILWRARDDNTTIYVVTRPPREQWHKLAVQRLADSGRANIALVSELHTKLFTAQTAETSFAMLGSANFTAKSLLNREIGVLIKGTGDGKAVVRNLDYEAAQLYRHPDRQLICRARL